MLEFIKKVILIGSGLAILTTEKLEEMVQEIVRKGHLSEKEGRELMEDLREKSRGARKELSGWVERKINEALERLNVPTRREVDDLKARLERLERARIQEKSGQE